MWRISKRPILQTLCCYCSFFTLLTLPSSEAGEVQRLVALSKAKQPLYGNHEAGLVHFSAVEAKEALLYIAKNPDYTSFHLLFSLHRYHRKEYDQITPEIRAAIMASALENVLPNDWGLLEDDYWKGCIVAKEFVKLDDHALERLVPILDNTTRTWCRASGYGSEISTLSDAHHYRRCDYAYQFAVLLLGEKPVFHRDLVVRDTEIERLKKRLANRQRVMAY